VTRTSAGPGEGREFTYQSVKVGVAVIQGIIDGTVSGGTNTSHTIVFPALRTLLDFNIASRVGDRVKTVSGTPPYQAPDADYTRWDVSTDLFATGVVLYELLCDGEHPYPGGNPMVGEEVRDPRSIRSDLNAALAKFLVRACAPERTERFGVAQEMKDALEEIRSTF